ncbi:MAG: hypothetical protein ACT4TC_15205 [Myxococcaceae bacterium]
MFTTMILSGLALTLLTQLDRPHAVSASNQGLTAYVVKGSLPHSDTFLQGGGVVSLDLTDRVRGAAAMSGDSGRLYARLSVGGASYEIHLDRIGFTRADLSAGAGLRHPIEGGVMFDRWLNGATGFGFAVATPVHAMAAVWGVGRVIKDGQTLTDRALIHAAALDRGSHSDDSTHRMLPQARAGDGEIYILAENLPVAAEPTGFVQVEFDDVRISYDSQSLALLNEVPNVPDTGTPVVSYAGGPSTFTIAESGTGGSGLAPPTVTASPLAYLPMSGVTLLPGTLTTPAAAPSASGTATPLPLGSNVPPTPPASSTQATPTLPGTGTLPAIGGNPGVTPSAGPATLPPTGGSSGLVSSVRPSSPELVSPGIPATPDVLTADTPTAQPVTPQTLPTAFTQTPQVLRSGTPSTVAEPSTAVTPLTPLTPIANNGSQVTALPATPAPTNVAAATPLPTGISPANALPASTAPSLAPVR